jgi:16S rRNA (guanine527-N7)-methyltransferase
MYYIFMRIKDKYYNAAVKYIGIKYHANCLLLRKLKAPMQEITTYFPDLTETQLTQFAALEGLYTDWNAKINVISRKDIESLYTKHVLHSLGIAKIMSFAPGASVLDVGTGGGFPGIPLAILFPETNFLLVDVIAKKIKVVQEVANALGLKNLRAEQKRAELIDEKFDFIVSRAVTNMPDFVKWVKDIIKKKQLHDLKNGILYLKGGDLSEELADFPKATQYNLADFFADEFFETKKVVHLPLKFKP